MKDTSSNYVEIYSMHVKCCWTSLYCSWLRYNIEKFWTFFFQIKENLQKYHWLEHSIVKYNTPRQNKKDWRAQECDYNYWKVLKITRILMYILTPREFGFQRNLDFQFPPFWIQISRKFRESSLKFCYALWNSTLKNRFSLWHLRFDYFLLVKYRDFWWTRSKISHFGRKNNFLIKITKPSAMTQRQDQ
jgi:hypothetical protein